MAKSATHSNDFDPAFVNSVLAQLDAKDFELSSEQGSYRARRGAIQDEIKSIYDLAKGHGVPTIALKALMTIRRNERKNVQIFTNLEADSQETLARLAATEKVKDLPLWRSAEDRKALPPADLVKAWDEAGDLIKWNN